MTEKMTIVDVSRTGDRVVGVYFILDINCDEHKIYVEPVPDGMTDDKHDCSACPQCDCCERRLNKMMSRALADIDTYRSAFVQKCFEQMEATR